MLPSLPTVCSLPSGGSSIVKPNVPITGGPIENFNVWEMKAMGHHGHTPGRRHGVERGAALVEFALILPVFMMLVLGTFTGAIAYNQKADLSHAANEGARYGGTLPQDQTTFTSPATNWATAVQ